MSARGQPRHVVYGEGQVTCAVVGARRPVPVQGPLVPPVLLIPVGSSPRLPMSRPGGYQLTPRLLPTMGAGAP